MAEELTDRQHEVYMVVIGIVLDDLEPTLPEIARRLGVAGHSGAVATCKRLQESGWLNEQRRPIDGPGRIIRDIYQAGSRPLSAELRDRIDGLVEGYNG